MVSQRPGCSAAVQSPLGHYVAASSESLRPIAREVLRQIICKVERKGSRRFSARQRRKPTPHAESWCDPKSVETNLDAADTSVRATSGRPGLWRQTRVSAPQTATM